MLFQCPYLNADVELSDERSLHIAQRHPDLLPDHHDFIVHALSDPDQVRRSSRFPNARLFTREIKEFRGGKHVVVVVICEYKYQELHWIITAYITRKLTGGEIEWKRD
jgi:hypothetical protein